MMDKDFNEESPIKNEVMIDDCLLINGDCYEIIKTIPDKSIDLVYVDIPYIVSFQGKGSIGKRINNIKSEMKDKDNITKGIDYKILDEFVRVLKKVHCYIWCSRDQMLPIMNFFNEKKCRMEIYVWCKDNPIPYGNRQFLSDKEYCLIFYEKGTRVIKGIDHKHTWHVSHINYKDKKLYGHPTIKPLDCVIKHLENSTIEGELVLDCFMGSGTTGVACKRLKRGFIGIEIDETYFKIAEERIKKEND